jgi:CsoR family transcriptional regulator, copper-sensing transcriptional repressor
MAKKDKVKEEKKEDKKEKKIALDHSEEMKRLNRVVGQIEGISKMLGDKRKLAEVLVQFKAAHSALRGIEERVFLNFAEAAVDDIIGAEKRKEREEKIQELLEIYKAG